MCQSRQGGLQGRDAYVLPASQWGQGCIRAASVTVAVRHTSFLRMQQQLHPARTTCGFLRMSYMGKLPGSCVVAAFRGFLMAACPCSVGGLRGRSVVQACRRSCMLECHKCCSIV
jgi:hypothetical protein